MFLKSFYFESRYKNTNRTCNIFFFLGNKVFIYTSTSYRVSEIKAGKLFSLE